MEEQVNDTSTMAVGTIWTRSMASERAMVIFRAQAVASAMAHLALARRFDLAAQNRLPLM
jgi:hypothetical protein